MPNEGTPSSRVPADAAGPVGLSGGAAGGAPTSHDRTEPAGAGHDGVSDEQLLATFVDDSRRSAERQDAFRELVRRYRRRLFAVCLRVLGSPDDAEDAVQDTFVKLARSAADFRGDARLSTWLYRVARNVCTDHVRYDARRPSTPVEDVTTAAPEATVEDHAAVRATALTIERALHALDEQSRRLLLLVAVDGLSYGEVADAEGLPIGTVKSRVSRARVQLGRLLADDDDSAAAARPGHPRNPTAGGAVPPGPSRGPPAARTDPEPS